MISPRGIVGRSRQAVRPLDTSDSSACLRPTATPPEGLGQTTRKSEFCGAGSSKNDLQKADNQRAPFGRQEGKRTDRGAFQNIEKPSLSKAVQPALSTPATVIAPCKRYPQLRCFKHLRSYDKFVVPGDSFTENCSRGKLIGTRPPKPGMVSSNRYDRLPPHIRSLMNFRQELIHPAVLRVGLQMGRRKITGTNSRTAAMLTAFQRFIEDYSPAPYQAIDKHLKQMLDRQINFITSCRPHSIAMGGTIRWLKRRLSGYKALQLEDTRTRLSSDISHFIAGRILSATWAVASVVEQKLIEDEDHIMIFGKSTAVICALLQAKRQGIKFSVVLVDTYHSSTGRAAAKELAAADIHITFTLLNGLSYHIRGVTKVFLGCAALLANGYVLNSAGAATVAMITRVHAKPVVILAESYKMSDRVILDSCSFNELNDPLLVWRPSAAEASQQPPAIACRLRHDYAEVTAAATAATAAAATAATAAAATAAATAAGPGADKEQPRCSSCHSEFEVPVANPSYDVCPLQFIDYVVTEEGIFPSSNVPALICGLRKAPALSE